MDIRAELILESQTSQSRWTLTDGEWVLGRDPGVDLLLSLPVVSRRQLRLICGPDGCWVENLSRTNPTYLMGQPLHTPTLLRDGDLLGIGRLRLRYRAKPGQASPQMKGRLLIQQAGRPDLHAPLSGAKTIIGRDPTCDVILDYPAISRRHLLLEWVVEHGYRLVDLRPDRSSLLPLVDDQPLYKPTFLQPGNRIWLGDALGNGVTLTFLTDNDANMEDIHG